MQYKMKIFLQNVSKFFRRIDYTGANQSVTLIISIDYALAFGTLLI